MYGLHLEKWARSVTNITSYTRSDLMIPFSGQKTQTHSNWWLNTIVIYNIYDVQTFLISVPREPLLGTFFAASQPLFIVWKRSAWIFFKISPFVIYNYAFGRQFIQNDTAFFLGNAMTLALLVPCSTYWAQFTHTHTHYMLSKLAHWPV